MNASWHPEAEAEVISAARWYSERLPGLGGDFLDAVDAAVQDILKDPARFALLSEDIRLYFVRRFPYGIYFRVLDDTVRILTVRHHRQRPARGKDAINPGFSRHACAPKQQPCSAAAGAAFWPARRQTGGDHARPVGQPVRSSDGRKRAPGSAAPSGRMSFCSLQSVETPCGCRSESGSLGSTEAQHNSFSCQHRGLRK